MCYVKFLRVSVFLGIRRVFGSVAGVNDYAYVRLEMVVSSLDSAVTSVRLYLSGMPPVKLRIRRGILILKIISRIFQWLPESARYHVASGQPDKALETLKQVALDNNKPMLLGRLVVDDTVVTERGCIKDLLIPQLRLTSILLWFIWYEGFHYLFADIHS